MTEEAIVDAIKKSAQLIELRRFENALDVLSEFPISNDYSDSVFQNRCICYMNLEKYDELKSQLDLALEQNPENSTFYNYLAFYHKQVEEYSKAQKAIEIAIEIDPNNASNYAEATSINTLIDNYKKAKYYLSIAEELNPTSLEVIHAQAIYYFNKNEQDAAKSSINNGLELFPNDSVLNSLRTNLLINTEKGSRKEAEEAAFENLSQNPNDELAKKNLLEVLKQRNFLFRIFAGNAFNRYTFEWTAWRIILCIVLIKSMIIWGGFALIYLLFSWYGGVLFNTFIRLHSRYKLLLSKSDILQSNVFLILNGVIVLFNVITIFVDELSEMKVATNVVLFSVLLMIISFYELAYKSGKIKFLVYCIISLGVILYFGSTPFILVFITIMTLLIYAFFFTIQVGFK